MTQTRPQIQLLFLLSTVILLISAYPAEKRKKGCDSSLDSEPDLPNRRAENKAAYGGIFLKHLRFRDLDNSDEKAEFEKELELLGNNKDEKKRSGSLSVSALADMLSSMRQRQQSGSGGVRMQTLRFGRK